MFLEISDTDAGVNKERNAKITLREEHYRQMESNEYYIVATFIRS